jgi:SAM-dependent methyltransferase
VGTIPAEGADVWGEDDNARRYDEYARRYPNYRETSRDLVELALPSADAGVADAAVLDLACGTGATTREILAVLGPHGRVTGVDQSAAMLEVAASCITDPRVRWIQARAESIDQHVPGTVDAIVCNSAVWQTDLAATAMAARGVLRTGGRFAFNVPVDFLGAGADHGSGDRYPSLLSEMQAIAEHDYGWAPPDNARGRPRRRLTRESISRSLEAAGFDVELVTEVSHQSSAASARAWLAIPVFTRDRLRGLSYAERMRVLDKAYERLGPGETERGQWLVFVWRARDSGNSAQCAG